MTALSLSLYVHECVVVGVLNFKYLTCLLDLYPYLSAMAILIHVYIFINFMWMDGKSCTSVSA